MADRYQLRFKNFGVEKSIKNFGRMADQYQQTKIMATAIRAAQRPVLSAVRRLVKQTKSYETGALLRHILNKSKSYPKNVVVVGMTGVKKTNGPKKKLLTIARQTSTKKEVNPDGRNRIPAHYFHLIEQGVKPHRHPVKMINVNGRRVAIRKEWIHPGFPGRNITTKARQATFSKSITAFKKVYAAGISKLAAAGGTVIKS